jgi:perosamine synthetase
VGSGVYYPKLVFDYDAFRSHARVKQSEVPMASKIVQEVVSLPVHTALSDADITEIVSAVRAVAGA